MNVFDQMPVGYCTVSESGLIIEANLAAVTLLGRSRDDVLGQPISGFILDPDQAAGSAFFEKLRATGHPDEIELRMDRSGSSFWAGLHAARDRDEPQARAIHLILTDVTARRQPEEARSEALQRMRAQRVAISDASGSDAFVVGDVEQLAREITELSAKTVGVERANVWLFNEDETELRCIDLYEATPARHSSGAVLKAAEYAPEFEVLRKVRFVDADEPLTDPRTAGYVEGYVKPLRITAMLDAVVEVSGHKLGVLCLEHVDRPHHWERDEVDFACQLADKIALSLVNRARREAQETLRASEVRYRRLFESAVLDITERKRAEEELGKLSRIVEQAPLSVAITDLSGAIEYVNPMFTEVTGYEREEVLGRNPRVLQSGGTPPEVHIDMWRTITSGHVWRGEFQNRRKNGDIFTELAVVAPVVGPNGSATHYVALKEDITGRKEAERTLQESLREKEALLREVHHRVKNNLQVITSLLRLEAGRSDELGTRLVLKEMQGRILSMALLHETLYRSGDFGRVDLAHYLQQLSQRLFRAQGPGSGSAELVLDLSPVHVQIDQAIPCGLVVNEMLTNALKHGFAGGQTGQVRVILRPDSEDRVHLEVRDNGVGLPPDFEARREKSLGLQLISDLARQLGGRLEVGPGPGACFTVVFPKAKPHTTGPTSRPRPEDLRP